MIIPPLEILRTMKDDLPVRGLSERELTSPEGVGFDLRLASVYVAEGDGELLQETRSTSSTKMLVASDDGVYTLTAKNWYLVQTIETVHLPLSLAGVIYPRSTLFRSGVALHTSIAPPGYEGPLIFGLSLQEGHSFRIQHGARFCHLVLSSVNEGATNYRGQWSGGRVSQPDSERQV